MKCILHIGPPKTGSTFIQAFLRQNKETLLESGILALASNGMSRKPPFMFRDDNSLINKLRRQGKPSEKKIIEKLRKDTDAYIQSQIREHNPDTLVLSSEGITLLSNNEFANMREYFQAFTSELEIVFFLRRPDFRATSGYKNKIRNRGMTEDIDANYSKIFDDGKTIKKLGKCFGFENITPIICKDSHPGKADADGHIEALLKVLFKDAEIPKHDFITPDRRNTAWDFKAMYYMRTFNRMVEGNPELEKYRVPLGDLLQERFSGGEKLSIEESVAKAIVAEYKNGGEFIRNKYFPNQKTLFHMDFSMYDIPKDSQKFGTEEAIFVSIMLLENCLKDLKPKSE